MRRNGLINGAIIVGIYLLSIYMLSGIINHNFNLKMKSIMENMNNKEDPRSNLLYSLKPYLRDSKKEKLDQYVNLLNISEIAKFMNDDNTKRKE